MKEKFKKSPIFVLLTLAVALDMRFAQIFNIKYLNTNGIMTLIVVIIAALLFFNAIVNNYIYNTLKPYRNYTNFFLILMALSIVIITIYSYNLYGQSFINYFSCFRIYLYFMLAVPILFILSKHDGFEDFMKVMIFLTLLYIFLCFFNSLHLKYLGRLYFKTLQFGMRNGRLRCQIPCTFIFVLPYVFNKMFTEKLKKDKAKWALIFAVFVIFIYYVAMTRMLNMAFYVFLGVSIVLLPKDTNLRRTILIIYLIVLFVLVASGKINAVVAYFQARDTNLNDSAEARMNSIKYFYGFAKNNPLFSMGYVAPTNSYFMSIFSGPKYSFFFDDVGIINVFLHYGIIGTIPFLIYVIRIIYLTVKIYFINKSPNKSYFMGVLIFTSVCQVSLCMFDGQRIMGAVILWALFEFEAYRTSQKSEKEKHKRISIRRNNDNNTIQLRVDKSRR